MLTCPGVQTFQACLHKPHEVCDCRSACQQDDTSLLDINPSAMRVHDSFLYLFVPAFSVPSTSGRSTARAAASTPASLLPVDNKVVSMSMLAGCSVDGPPYGGLLTMLL